MNWIYTAARWLVGGLFIFSGLIKVNDPVGTAIKLEEYFVVFSSDISPVFGILEPFALVLSVILVVLEVALGVAVIINYRMKLTSWVLLLLILFFSFLTFYSAYFNKVTDCGCFGDAIKLTPWESFIKDVILLVLIAMIFVKRKWLQPAFKKIHGEGIMATVVVVNLVLAIVAILYLPYLDFRAYKKGTDIEAGMLPTEGLRYQYIMEKDGELVTFDEYPTDTTYQYRDIVLMNPEAQPLITDFAVWNREGEDVTTQTLTGSQLLLVVHFAESSSAKSMTRINRLLEQTEGQLGIMVLTASDEATFDAFRHQVQLAAPFYFADATVLKTMIRSNPGLILLKDGVVLGKWSHRNLPASAELLDLARR